MALLTLSALPPARPGQRPCRRPGGGRRELRGRFSPGFASGSRSPTGGAHSRRRWTQTHGRCRRHFTATRRGSGRGAARGQCQRPGSWGRPTTGTGSSSRLSARMAPSRHCRRRGRAVEVAAQRARCRTDAVASRRWAIPAWAAGRSWPPTLARGLSAGVCLGSPESAHAHRARAGGLAAARGDTLVHFDALPHNVLLRRSPGAVRRLAACPAGRTVHRRADRPGQRGRYEIDLDSLLASQAVSARTEPPRRRLAVLAALTGFWLAGGLAELPSALKPIAAAKLVLGRSALSWLQRRLGAR